MRSGAGRAPLIIAAVAALLTYAAFGEQTPFGFLHHLGRHHPKITVSTDKSTDAADDARQAAEDQAQQEADRAQEMRDRAQEMSERAREIAQTAAETAKTAIPAIPPIPPIPATPAAPTTAAEVRTLDPFDSITIENNATATITIGDTQSVSITGNGHTETRVHDGKLVVSGSMPDVHVAITLPHLRALQVNGVGQISLEGLRDSISIKANGSVQLSASGTVDSAELTMNGPSKFALAKLEAKNMVVQVNGVGDADVYATENLVADVKGVGHVQYRGNPHLVTKINGPGTVEHLTSSQG